MAGPEGQGEVRQKSALCACFCRGRAAYVGCATKSVFTASRTRGPRSKTREGLPPTQIGDCFGDLVRGLGISGMLGRRVDENGRILEIVCDFVAGIVPDMGRHRGAVLALLGD